MLKNTSRNRTIYVLLGGIAAALLAVAFFINGSRPKPAAEEPFKPKAVESTSAGENSPAAAPSSANPAPAATPTVQSDNLIVDTPTSGSKVSSGTIVRGKARVFEGRVSYRLKAKAGGQLDQGSVQVSGDSSQLSPFSFSLSLSGGQPGDSGVLDVYSVSPKDGSDINVVSVPVVIE